MKVPILIPNIFNHPFTYNSDLNLKVGDYVAVPFGKSEVTIIIHHLLNTIQVLVQVSFQI